MKEAEFYQIGPLTKAIGEVLSPSKPKLKIPQQQLTTLMGLRSCQTFGLLDDLSRTYISAVLRTTANVTLNDLDLTGLSFTGIHFKHTCSFKGSILKNVSFSECIFVFKTDLSDIDLTNATFTKCKGLLNGLVDFTGAIHDGIKFDGEIIRHIRF